MKYIKIFESISKDVLFTDACGEGDLETVKKLIKEVDPSDANNIALRLAAESGNLNTVKLLLNDERVYNSLTKREREQFLGDIPLVRDMIANLNK